MQQSHIGRLFFLLMYDSSALDYILTVHYWFESERLCKLTLLDGLKLLILTLVSSNSFRNTYFTDNRTLRILKFICIGKYCCRNYDFQSLKTTLKFIKYLSKNVQLKFVLHSQLHCNYLMRQQLKIVCNHLNNRNLENGSIIEQFNIFSLYQWFHKYLKSLEFLSICICICICIWIDV